MPAASVSNQVEPLKRLFPTKIHDPWFQRSKLALKMKKDTNFGAESRYVIVGHAPGSGASSVYSTAIANRGTDSYKRFTITRKKEYAVFDIENELIEASKGNQNAVQEALKSAADKARYSYFRSAARKLWGNGGGALGRLNASVNLATAVLVLRNVGDQAGIEVGMKLQFALDDGTAASPAGLLASGATLTVLSVSSRGTATLGMSAVLNTITGITADAYVFREGDYGNAMTGIPGWNPIAAPSGSLFGVDRSTGDVQRMAGYIHADAVSTTKRQRLVRALAAASSAGVTVTDIYVHPIDYGELCVEMPDREVRVDDKSTSISYASIMINGPDGQVSICSEPDVPKGNYWGLNVEDIYARSLGEMPHAIIRGGNQWLEPVQGEDSRRGTIGSYANFFHENPGNSLIGSWSA